MGANDSRPTVVSVIGWGAIVVGILMFFSGGMAALAASMMPPEGPVSPMPSRGPIDFVFENVLYFGLAQMGLVIVIVMAGRALLRLRKWGAQVIQAFAAFLIVYAAVFAVYFAIEFRHQLSSAEKSPPVGFVLMMGLTTVFTLVFWMTPTLLTIYHLRKLFRQHALE
jgi:hypothetical protein